ncbi:MAG: gluconate 2-dehydrogenase subunit 3 family protein, partial [Bacteroidota bacterium]
KTQAKLKADLETWLAEVAASGTAYAELGAERQLALLNELDAAAKVKAESLEEQEGLTDEEKEDLQPWWLEVKGMMIGAYFTSEKVGLEVLAYDPVPGAYPGCIPLSEVGKSWSLS